MVDEQLAKAGLASYALCPFVELGRLLRTTECSSRRERRL